MSDFDPGPGWRDWEFEAERGHGLPKEHLLWKDDDGYEHYYVRQEPVPPLPTEPGYYLTTEPDYGGGPVVVELLNSPAEQWVDAGDREYLNRKQVEDMLPLVRLEPRAATAKAVLDRLPLRGATRGQLVEWAKSVANEFGVSDAD